MLKSHSALVFIPLLFIFSAFTLTGQTGTSVISVYNNCMMEIFSKYNVPGVSLTVWKDGEQHIEGFQQKG